MKIKTLFIAAILFIAILSINSFDAYGRTHGDESHNVNNSSTEKLRTDMRKLWEDHIVWTRNVILNLVDELPGTNESVARLLKNQEDIGNAVKLYYGEDAGNKLTALLKDHINIAADVVTAAKKGDNAALNDASQRWNKNADEIAAFLSSANPNWKLLDMKNMMNDHLKFTTDEAVARIQKDYSADIAAYDKVHNEILMMADDLSNGIINQFPDKFKK